MKKLKYFIPLLTIGLIIIASSCSKTDPAPQGPQLKGTWTYAGWSNQNCTNPALDPLGFVCTDCHEVWTDSTITGSGWLNYTAKYKVNGNSITFSNATGDIHFPEPTYSGTYELNSNTLIITVDATWTGCQMVKSYTR
jgi:hypothetical protein